MDCNGFFLCFTCVSPSSPQQKVFRYNWLSEPLVFSRSRADREHCADIHPHWQHTGGVLSALQWRLNSQWKQPSEKTLLSTCGVSGSLLWKFFPLSFGHSLSFPVLMPQICKPHLNFFCSICRPDDNIIIIVQLVLNILELTYQ